MHDFRLKNGNGKHNKTQRIIAALFHPSPTNPSLNIGSYNSMSTSPNKATVAAERCG